MIDILTPPHHTSGMDPASIRRLRAHLNINQHEFAALLHVSRVTISKWENGVSRPHPLGQRMLRQLADQTYGPLVSE